jgi:NADH dehydrogenase FAD-containing subunit
MVDKGGPASTWEYSATATVRRGRLAARESPWRIAIFNTIVASSTLILEVADVVLRLALFAARALRLALYAVGLKAATTGLLRRLARGIPGPRRRVVIVGASFGGLACARMLRRDFDVTIVDQHDWFEYTPGILRLFVKPEHLESLSASLHGISGVKFVHGKVDRLGASSVRVRAAEGVEVSEAERLFGSKLPFDYAVVACGSSYAAGIKAGPSTPSLHQRRSFWFAQAQRVAAAKTVVIVGGGPVGVELAAEVAVFFPSTKVVLVHSGQRLVSDFAHPVADHSLAWLRKHSVDVLLGHRCEEMPHADTLRMDAPTALRSDRPSPCASSLLVRGAEHPEGLRIDADLVFWCRGGPPCSDGIRPPAQDAGAVQGAAPTSVEDDWSRSGGESGGESGGALPLSPDATICVDSLLQVQGREDVFAVGDVMSVGTARDERLGHTAEVQARVAAHNIRHRAIHHDASLLTHAQRHHSRCATLHSNLTRGLFLKIQI